MNGSFLISLSPIRNVIFGFGLPLALQFFSVNIKLRSLMGLEYIYNQNMKFISVFLTYHCMFVNMFGPYLVVHQASLLQFLADSRCSMVAACL